ncbi:hypothetical protein [Mumia sp. Pv 4-285]|uniref:hypothetical protein n=1 Tax=Mumia qirimensis TaxID=3234852 RepID=UPI00351D9238
MRRAATLVVPLLLAGSLGACGDGDGDDEPPAVCSSVDTLQDSVEELSDIDVTSQGSLAELKDGIPEVGDALADVKAEAKSEFATPLSAAESSWATLQAALDAAVASPTGATLSAAGTALSTFGQDVKTLVSDVESTC